VSPRAKKVPPPLHELEAEVMEEVWRHDAEVSVRQVREALNTRRGSKERAYTTIMTIMSRLEKKGLLTRHRQGKAYHYQPSMSREQYFDARARGEVEGLVSDYGDLALTHFARQMEKLDPQRRAKLRRLARRS
jgi:predicted transcriptional regulator